MGLLGIAAVVGAVYLIVGGYNDGWGWLLLLAFGCAGEPLVQITHKHEKG